MRVNSQQSHVPWRVLVGSRGPGTEGYVESEVVTREGVWTESVTSTRGEIVKGVAAGNWRPPLPYSMEERKSAAIRGNATFMSYGFNQDYFPNQSSWVRWDGVLTGISVDDTYEALSTNEWDKLNARALSRLKNQQVNLSMILATRKQTVEMLADSARALVKAWSYAKRRQFGAAAKQLGIRNSVRPGTKSASSGWLQLQFGWMPLINDVYGLYNEATAPVVENGMTIVVRARDQKSSVTQGTYGPWPVHSKSTSKLQVHYEQSYQRTGKLSYWWKLDSAALQAAARMGLTNPAMVLWDIVPFSFVVDWLLPVGQFLDNLDATVGFTYLGGSRTEFHRINRKISRAEILRGQPLDGYLYLKETAQYNGDAHLVKMDRTVLPEPSSTIHVRNPFSTFTVVSTAALILQRAKA